MNYTGTDEDEQSATCGVSMPDSSERGIVVCSIDLAHDKRLLLAKALETLGDIEVVDSMPLRRELCLDFDCRMIEARDYMMPFIEKKARRKGQRRHKERAY